MSLASLHVFHDSLPSGWFVPSINYVASSLAGVTAREHRREARHQQTTVTAVIESRNCKICHLLYYVIWGPDLFITLRLLTFKDFNFFVVFVCVFHWLGFSSPLVNQKYCTSPPPKKKKSTYLVSVLLPAQVKRFGVSLIQDLYNINSRIFIQNYLISFTLKKVIIDNSSRIYSLPESTNTP